MAAAKVVRSVVPRADHLADPKVALKASKSADLMAD